MGRASQIALYIVGFIIAFFGFAFFVYAMVEVPAIFAGSYLIFGLLMSAAGIAVMYIGYRTRPKNASTTRKEPTIESVFCRYCGNKSVSGEFCSACGKNSQSQSVNMKICRSCNSTMSDDSIYCANCGRVFQK